MFSFHKPKIYRSLKGCCICRAKSSSSRFTDSKRYEGDFAQCFQIREQRRGEICNACVLLVKRWKKLPNATEKNWNHVVDARAGPGTKSITKIKNRAKEELKEYKKLKKHKHRYQPRKTLSSPGVQRPLSPPLSDETYVSDLSSDVSDDEVALSLRRRHRRTARCPLPSKRKTKMPPSRHTQCHEIDTSYWKRTEVCCGIVYIGANCDVLIQPNDFHPCDKCTGGKSQEQQSLAVRITGKRLDSESSTESGVVCEPEDDMKFGLTPPQTQPSSPLNAHNECNMKFSAEELALDLSSTKVADDDDDDDLLFDDEADELMSIVPEDDCIV